MSDLAKFLLADGPNPEHSRALRLYGQFVGDWDADIIAHAPDGASHRASGEIHFDWVLEGRAIQDVWMIPRPAGAPVFPVAGNWYGTTLRVYDPRIDAWRIYWIDPGRCVFRQQIGRASAAGIVQEGTTESGELSRWSFADITAESFLWRGEAKPAAPAEWRLAVEVRARRRQGSR